MKHWKRIIAVFALCMLSVGLISAQPALAGHDRNETRRWELDGGAGTKERDENEQSSPKNQLDTEKTGWVYENGLWHYYEDGEVHSVANMLLSFPYERGNGGSAIGENPPERRIIGIGIPETNTGDGAIIPDTLSSDSGPDVLPAGSALIVSDNGDMSIAPMTGEQQQALDNGLNGAAARGREVYDPKTNSWYWVDGPDQSGASFDAAFLNGENSTAFIASNPIDLDITGSAKVDTVVLGAGAAASTVTVEGGSSVDTMTIGAEGSTVHVEAGASVSSLVLDAPGATVTADGTVQNVTLTGNGTDAKLDGAGIQQKTINADALKAGKTADITLKVGQRAVIPIKCGKNASVTVNVTITPPTAGTPVIEGLDGAFASAGNGQYTASLEDVAFRKFKVVIDAKEDMSFSISMTGIEADGEETDDSANQQEDGNAAESGENTAQSSGHTHVWGNWKQTTAPTCTEKGEETRACQVENCKETETRDVNAKGHDWGEWTVTTPATATAEGVETRICQRDASHTETRPIPKLEEVPLDWPEDVILTNNNPGKPIADALNALKAKLIAGDEAAAQQALRGLATNIYQMARNMAASGTYDQRITVILDRANASVNSSGNTRADEMKQAYQTLLAVFGQQEEEIEEPWSGVRFHWSNDYSSCSVQIRVPHQEVADVWGECEVRLIEEMPATCEQGGKTIYYAEYTNYAGDESYSDTKEVETPALGHLWTEAWTQEEEIHYHACTRGCGAHLNEEPHTYANWHDNGDGTHTGTCVCGKTSTGPHTGDGAACELCGADLGVVSGHDHVWDTAWTTDGSRHWHKCTVPSCTDKKDEAAHSGGTATCVAKARCADCGEEYGELADHDWDTSAWITDGSKHWHKCKTEGCTATTDEADHSGGSATCQAKAKCTACGEEYGTLGKHDWDTSAWITDGSKHWHKCKTPGCSSTTDEAAHSGGTATCQAKAKCAVCSEDYGEKSTENHAGGTKKVYYTEGDTGYEYYVVCLSCGEKTGETGVTPYDDETFDPSTAEWDYGDELGGAS